MPKLWKFLKDQRGIVQLIPLLLILAGIIAGVYLVQKSGYQIFKPRAAPVQNIQFSAAEGVDAAGNSCRIYTEYESGINKLKTNCPAVNIKFTSPLETQGSSDAGSNLTTFQTISIVKPVNAQDRRGQNFYCGDDTGKLYQRAGRGIITTSCPGNTQCSRWEEGGKKGAECVGSDGKVYVSYQGEKDGWKCSDNNTKMTDGGWFGSGWFETKITCPPPSACTIEGNKAKCVVGGSASPKVPTIFKPTNSSPGEKDKVTDVTINANQTAVPFSWTTSEDVKNYNLIIDTDPDKDGRVAALNDCGDRYSAYYICTTTSSGTDSIRSSRFKDGATYTWWVDAMDANDKTIGTSDGFQITIHKAKAEGKKEGDAGTGKVKEPEKAPERPTGGLPEVNCQENPPVESPQGYKWVADCNSSCTVRLGTDDPHSDCPKNTSSGYVNAKTSNWCYGFKEGNRCLMLVYEGEAETVKTCKGESKTWAQIDAELKAANYDGAFDHSSQELAAYNRAACPQSQEAPGVGATSPQEPGKRMTVTFRFAESIEDLKNPEYGWRPYTPGGVTLRYPFLNSNPGTKVIYVQFKDNQGNIIDAVPFPASIEVSEVKKAEGTPVEPADKKKPSGECPLQTYQSFSITDLLQRCSKAELSKLPLSALKDFSNQDLLEIAKATADPYKFLANFDNDRLKTFDLSILKKLPEDRIKSLPESLQDAIKGTGSTVSEKASCTSISISGVVPYATVKFTGSPQSLKIWLASNSEIKKDAKDVKSWTPVKTISNPKSGSFYEISTSGFDKGQHAVLMSLHGSYGQMLDGNPGGDVNSSCTTSIDIQ